MDRETALAEGIKNKKKAYFAMCRVSLVLFVIAFASYAVSRLFGYITVNCTAELQTFAVRIITFFGVPATSAFAAARMLFSSSALYSLVDVISTLVTLVLPAYVFAKSTHLSPEESFEVKGKVLKGAVFAFCLVQLFTVTVNLFSQGFVDFLLPGIGDADFSNPLLGGEFDVFAFIMEVVAVCIFVPAAEEMVFRGVLLSYLRRYGTVFAVAASSVAFGIAHAEPVQSVYALVFGIMASFFTVVTGNLKTAILFHFANNFVMVLSEHMPLVVGQDNFDIIYTVYITVVLAFAFVGLYMLVKRGGYAEEFFEKSDRHDEKLAVKAGMSEIVAFPLVVYILFYAVRYIVTVLG